MPQRDSENSSGQIIDSALASMIEVSSRREAMDWSLVLISQGIESTVVANPNGDGWGLEVLPENHDLALAVLDQYRKENHGWGWHRAVTRTGFHFEWTAIIWVLLIVFFFELDSRIGLVSGGIVNRSVIARGEWWRIFTGVWLHADPAHLASNAVFGVLFLGFVMGRYGAGLGLFAAYLAGAGGNLMRCLVSLDQSSSLGASGMVTGALGMLAAQSFWLWRKAPQARKYVMGALASGVMFLTFFGFAPGTDVVAHVAGFVIGLFLGAALAGKISRPTRRKLNIASAILFAVLVILPWWMALRRPS